MVHRTYTRYPDRNLRWLPRNLLFQPVLYVCVFCDRWDATPGYRVNAFERHHPFNGRVSYMYERFYADTDLHSRTVSQNYVAHTRCVPLPAMKFKLL